MYTVLLTKGEGLVTETGLVANLGWEARRAKLALDQLVGSDIWQNGYRIPNA